MKKVCYTFLVAAGIALVSCGGDANNDENVANNEVKEVVLKGYEPLDLSQWGFDMTVMVPNAEDNGAPSVELTQRGALEIVVGQTFGIEIMYGEGDIELLKMDLNEDLVFSSEIVKEEENTLIYKQTIPESGVKAQNHFFHKVQMGADIYEVRDLIDGDYGMKMIEKMADAAKTIKATKETPSV